MKRTIAIGDIHGGLKGLEDLMSKIAITENDKLIFLGDYVDGWSESAQVIRYLMRLSQSNDCIFIRGNHDVWCEEWLRVGSAPPVWLQHGGAVTIESYKGLYDSEKQQHLQFFENMKRYYIDDNNRLFVHAGFTSKEGVDNEFDEANLYYDRSLWEMALTMDKRVKKQEDLMPNILKNYQEIYIGHTPTLRNDSPKPMNAINVWNVDTGAAFYGSLSAIDVDSKTIFQSEKLMELYPNEKGRNERSLNQLLGRS